MHWEKTKFFNYWTSQRKKNRDPTKILTIKVADTLITIATNSSNPNLFRTFQKGLPGTHICSSDNSFEINSISLGINKRMLN